MSENTKITKLKITEGIERQELYGNLDVNIKQVSEVTNTSITPRGDFILIRGDNCVLAADILMKFMDKLKSGEKLDRQAVNYIIDLKKSGVAYSNDTSINDIICYTHQGKPLRPKTMGQKYYADCIRKLDMVFGIGPAGTGKTYLACAMAVNALKNKEVDKIILARPAVEAGENLGFLPGDLQEKVDPYLRPLYDALFDIMGQESAERLKEKGIIEVVPLAYMRGRTLDNAFIVLDEAQNTTKEQMKMFLTRMGFNSKVVVTGDITQIDLPHGTSSGLVEATKVLENVKGIEFCYLTEIDVVRHELVKKIIKAYSNYNANSSQKDIKKADK